jgi:hypothetical protein
MKSSTAITPCQHVSDFHILGEKLYACHHPLPAKPPSRHHFFQLLAPACVLEKNVMARNTSDDKQNLYFDGLASNGTAEFCNNRWIQP